jgi:hypothetical protein
MDPLLFHCAKFLNGLVLILILAATFDTNVLSDKNTAIGGNGVTLLRNVKDER